MDNERPFDAIIIGGSYAGLAAGMALGRALRRVLIVDAGMPCNRQTPHSHNFLTQDGSPPHAIAAQARRQVEQYPTVHFRQGLVTHAARTAEGFEVRTGNDRSTAKKLVLATGIRDVLPPLPGVAECWGISVLHCPYCHGYEVRQQRTGVWANGERGFDLVRLISNWTADLTLFTNGPMALDAGQASRLRLHGIPVDERPIAELVHTQGRIEHIRFADGSTAAVRALYTQPAFEQAVPIVQELGCTLTDEGYVQVDAQQRTSVPGLYACGDNTTRLRTVANAVAQGTTTGMMLNKDLVAEEF